MTAPKQSELWGSQNGPLPNGGGQLTIAATTTIRLLDSSSVPRTPKDVLKTLAIVNPSTNTDRIVVGGVDLENDANDWIFEVGPGDPPLVIDTNCIGGAVWRVRNTGAGPQPIQFGQIG